MQVLQTLSPWRSLLWTRSLTVVESRSLEFLSSLKAWRVIVLCCLFRMVTHTGVIQRDFFQAFMKIKAPNQNILQNEWIILSPFLGGGGYISLPIVCMLSCFGHVWLCNPMGRSPPGSSVHGILQARILEWVAMPSSRGSSGPRDQTQVFCVSALACGFFTTSAT